LGAAAFPRQDGDRMSDLADLPVERVEAVSVQPGDTIVIHASERITMETADRIKAACRKVWPNNQCVVLEPTLDLTVTRPD
jgi:chemotaxis response regulator CheB